MLHRGPAPGNPDLIPGKYISDSVSTSLRKAVITSRMVRWGLTPWLGRRSEGEGVWYRAKHRVMV